MGQLLSLRKKDADVSPDIFIDFENANPSDKEAATYQAVAELMKPSAELLESLRKYSGCGEAIRKAISTPNKQTEDEAWAAVCPCVAKLKEFYDFSSTLENAFSQLLRVLCTTPAEVISDAPLSTSTANITAGLAITPIEKNLAAYQAVSKQLAQLLHFVLEFDDLKMTNPAIQNDFSYYRRTLNRIKMSQANAQSMMEMATVKDELANRMSLFYAYPTPMLKALVDCLIQMTGGTTNNTGMGSATSGAVPGDIIPVENVTECLSTMVSVCHNAIVKNRFQNENTMAFCLRVLVACIILYDHVHPKGAFVKSSDINIKHHIKLIQTHGGTHTDSLINTLRYTTKHLNDDSTPKSTRVMLG